MTMLSRSELQFQIEQNTVLCLACSSSIQASSLRKREIFFTPCCQRPICLSCTSANSRLVRYNPCLACLGGVAVVQSSSSQSLNLDGSLRDSNVYQIGDDSDDESDPQSSPPASCMDDTVSSSASISSSTSIGSSTFTAIGSSIADISSLPSSSVTGTSTDTHSILSTSDISQASECTAADTELDAAPVPYKYYISKGDTLQAISLRFGVSGSELCLMNQLPRSTLSTTPHLIHTREYLLLPASVGARLGKGRSSNISPEEEVERESRRSRERAGRKLQTVTKEVDWRVAKAYVALAEHATEEDIDQYHFKRKELGGSDSKPQSGIEHMAVDAYLDDIEWETRNPYKPPSSTLFPIPMVGFKQCFGFRN